jgi:hypothetical protein
VDYPPWGYRKYLRLYDFIKITWNMFPCIFWFHGDLVTDLFLVGIDWRHWGTAPTIIFELLSLTTLLEEVAYKRVYHGSGRLTHHIGLVGFCHSVTISYAFSMWIPVACLKNYKWKFNYCLSKYWHTSYEITMLLSLMTCKLMLSKSPLSWSIGS